MRPTTWAVSGIVVAAAIAVFLAPRASQAPDGLEKVARNDQVLSAAFEAPSGSAAPLEDYGIPGVRDKGLSTAIAGVLGALVAAALVTVGARLLLRRSHRAPGP
jgi:cobalt/nickel transport protein